MSIRRGPGSAGRARQGSGIDHGEPPPPEFHDARLGEVLHDGHFVARCGRGEGVGEIALLRDIPRTAAVVAHSAATVYELHRDPFLTAVLGHAPTQRQADRIADARLPAGRAPGDGHDQGPDAPEPG